MGKKLKLVFSALILGLCFCVLLCTVLLPKAPLRGNETAVPAPRIMLGGKLNTAFLDELSDWYAQRFAFRSEAITMDSLVLSGVFRTSNTNEVIVGKDGWLYYSSTADDYCNEQRLTDREIGNIAITLSLLEEAAITQNARFIFVPAPNKSTVYPEYMPDSYKVLPREGDLERLYTALDRENVTHTALSSLFAASDEILYHKTDSHWNNLGAAMASREILQLLGLKCEDLSAQPYTLREDFPGDLAAMLYPAISVPESQQVFDLSGLTESGASEDVLYETACETGTGTLYCWRDSFGNALSPLLAVNFREAVFSRAAAVDLTAAAEIDAGFVIWEIAERNIGNITLSAPVFEAPVREMELPADRTDTTVTASVSEADGLLRVSGNFDPASVDAGSRIYAVIGGTVFEATPAGGNDGSFTLYLPENASPDSLSLILTESEIPVLTAPIQLSPAE